MTQYHPEDNVVPFDRHNTASGNGPGGGDGGGSDNTELERRIGGVEQDLAGVRERLAGIEGKLSNMPTTFQMVTWFIGVTIALAALTFTVAGVTASW